MKALTIRQPWAWAILNAGKDIENRPQRWKYRGEILLHTSKNVSNADFNYGAAFINMALAGLYLSGKIEDDLVVPSKKDVVHGAIVGVAEITDCVEYASSPWFMGKYGYILKNVRPLIHPIYCNGALGLWNVPKEIADEALSKIG